jgi:hypothetical protein
MLPFILLESKLHVKHRLNNEMSENEVIEAEQPMRQLLVGFLMVLVQATQRH